MSSADVVPLTAGAFQCALPQGRAAPDIRGVWDAVAAENSFASAASQPACWRVNGLSASGTSGPAPG